MNNPKFQLYQSQSDKQYYFRFRDSSDDIILTSEGYTTKSACENGISSVKANAPYDDRYERKSNNGIFWFTLKARNGETIAKSKMYNSAVTRDNGIEKVKQEAPSAPTEYLA